MAICVPSILRSGRPAILAGPAAAIIVYVVLPASYVEPEGAVVPLAGDARAVLAMTAWMAVWWLTEALPVAATALLPVVAFPLLGLGSVQDVTAPYAHPLIFLFLGGFLLSIGIEKWSVHRWIAHRVMEAAAGDTRRLIGGLMAVTAFASMWLSNTATAIMMLPIALSLIAESETAGTAEEAARFARCLLLGIAYAASIGGMGTLIGSPPNLFVASFIETRFGLALDFRLWMALALPLVAVMLPLTWYLMTRHILPVRADLVTGVGGGGPSWRALGPGARRTAWVFAFAVVAWIGRPWLTELQLGPFRPLTGLTDTGIAMAAGLALFVLPASWSRREFLLTWTDAERLPLGTLLLFGGGLTLASRIAATGADHFIGAQLAGLAGAPGPLVFGLVVAVVVFLTELTSNTATTATLAPVLAAVAVALALDPLALVVVTALAASCAFMMPVATPPNAIVFSSGRVGVRAMARAGLLINLLAVVVVTVAGLVWVPRVLAALVAS